MKKKTKNKLHLKKQTIVKLNDAQMNEIAGGTDIISFVTSSMDCLKAAARRTLTLTTIM